MKLSEIKSAVMAGKTVSNAPNNTGEQLMTHPLTDELLQQIGCANPRARVFDTQAMRAAADWQLEQVIEWLKFGDQTDQNLSWERKRIGGFMEIAIALEQAMRPTNTQENN
jgi:hypothetical protein